jgi:hypothetical protein
LRAINCSPSPAGNHLEGSTGEDLLEGPLERDPWMEYLEERPKGVIWNGSHGGRSLEGVTWKRLRGVNLRKSSAKGGSLERDHERGTMKVTQERGPCRVSP